MRWGFNPEAFVLLYVGGMDTYHDLGPVIDALARISVPFLELHLVGDGEFRGTYEARAKTCSRADTISRPSAPRKGSGVYCRGRPMPGSLSGQRHFLTKQCRFRR